jgi:lysine biosynthesis protein LysW
MKTTHCLSCDSKIEIGSKARIGQFVYCEFCGADFEIIELNPIELDYAFIDDDDLDYEDEDDDDTYESPVYDDGDDNRQSRW